MIKSYILLVYFIFSSIILLSFQKSKPEVENKVITELEITNIEMKTLIDSISLKIDCCDYEFKYREINIEKKNDSISTLEIILSNKLFSLKSIKGIYVSNTNNIYIIKGDEESFTYFRKKFPISYIKIKNYPFPVFEEDASWRFKIVNNKFLLIKSPYSYKDCF